MIIFIILRSVTDPRDGKRVALKKMPNVFQNLVSCKRVFRELKMLCFFKHDNVSPISPKTWVLSNSLYVPSPWCRQPEPPRWLSPGCWYLGNNVMWKPTFTGVTADLCHCVFVPLQVLSALDILQPPHIDYFEEMYPKLRSTIPAAVKRWNLLLFVLYSANAVKLDRAVYNDAPV